MKSTLSRICALLCLIALLFVPIASGEAETDAASLLKEKHETTVYKALQMLARFGCDDASISNASTYFQKDSVAWSYLSRFDGGWFSTATKRAFGNWRTDGWEYVSDTEFCVNAYCEYYISYKYSDTPDVFSCAYHFCFKQTNKQKDFWQVYDFHNLPNSVDIATANQLTAESEGISVYAVNGNTFTGFMTVVEDPSRVFVGTINSFGSGSEGIRIDALIQKYQAVGGVNGGGFSDSGGKGNGGTPYGIVVSEGVQKRGHTPNDETYAVLMGFDTNNVLHVGRYTYSEAQNLGLRDALAFSPALIIDDKDVDNQKVRNNFSVRTAIGQDAEGRVLLLVAKGRQPDSLGANMIDLTKIMREYGAINAGNLDGGSSTCLYLNNQSVYSGFRLNYSRRIPAGFLIRAIQ